MGGIGYADYQSATQSAAQAKPEGRQDDRQVVEPLKDGMEVREMKRRKIVEKTDADDEH